MATMIMIKEWKVYIHYKEPVISSGRYGIKNDPEPNYICDQMPIVHQSCFELHTTKGKAGTIVYIMNNDIASIEFMPILPTT